MDRQLLILLFDNDELVDQYLEFASQELGRIKINSIVEKIKKKSGKGSRVIGVKLKIINLLYVSIDKDTNKLLREFSEHIEDFSTAYDNIFLIRKTHTIKECRKYIQENFDILSNKNFFYNSGNKNP